MAKYELTSKEISLLCECLMWHGMNYDCQDQEYQKNIRTESESLYCKLLEDHNNQEENSLKHYTDYCKKVVSTRDLLLAKSFFGTLDRMENGVITEKQAIAEMNGDFSHKDMKMKDWTERIDGVFGRTWNQIEQMQGGKLKRNQ